MKTSTARQSSRKRLGNVTDTTDTQIATVESVAESLLEPIAEETEAEADVAETQDETDAEEVEADSDASEATDENEGEEDVSEDDTDADEDTDDEDDDSEVEPLFTVKVNGEERQITEQELKNDFSGRAALQERHEALKLQEAEFRRAQDTVQEQSAVVMQLYQQSQQQGFLQKPEMPDIRLRETDPIAYYDAKDDFDRKNAEYEAQQAQVAQLQQHQAQYQQQAVQTARANAEQTLLQKHPELSQPEKAETFRKDLQSAVKHYGYSTDELQGILTDPRSVEALVDAWKWRKLQAGKEKAKQPKPQAKVVTKPKAKTRTNTKARKQQDAAKRARQSQSVEDWAATLLE